MKNKWAVIWKRDKKILALYGFRKTSVVTGEWEPTTGKKQEYTSYMIFETKVEAENWREGNTDWEVVKCSLVFNDNLTK